jgi:hypothetical protein
VTIVIILSLPEVWGSAEALPNLSKQVAAIFLNVVLAIARLIC